MAFVLKYVFDIAWVPDGVGPMEVPSSAVLRFFPTANNPAGVSLGSGAFAQGSLIPGANAPTAANITTALNNAVTDMNAQIAAAGVLARIQAFATGGG
jgi:hypothetical protein